MALKRDFRKWQKDHPNFVTPNILKLHEKDNSIIEISTGRGLEENTTLYGVTELIKTKSGWETKGGKVFNDLKSAKEYAHKRLLKKVI